MNKKMWLSNGAVMINMATGMSSICKGIEVEVLGVMNERPYDSIIMINGGAVYAVMTSKLQPIANNSGAPWCSNDTRIIAAKVMHMVREMSRYFERSERSILFAIRKEVDKQIHGD